MLNATQVNVLKKELKLDNTELERLSHVIYKRLINPQRSKSLASRTEIEWDKWLRKYSNTLRNQFWTQGKPPRSANSITQLIKPLVRIIEASIRQFIDSGQRPKQQPYWNKTCLVPKKGSQNKNTNNCNSNSNTTLASQDTTDDDTDSSDSSTSSSSNTAEDDANDSSLSADDLGEDAGDTSNIDCHPDDSDSDSDDLDSELDSGKFVPHVGVSKEGKEKTQDCDVIQATPKTDKKVKPSKPKTACSKDPISSEKKSTKERDKIAATPLQQSENLRSNTDGTDNGSKKTKNKMKISPPTTAGAVAVAEPAVGSKRKVESTCTPCPSQEAEVPAKTKRRKTGLVGPSTPTDGLAATAEPITKKKPDTEAAAHGQGLSREKHPELITSNGDIIPTTAPASSGSEAPKPNEELTIEETLQPMSDSCDVNNEPTQGETPTLREQNTFMTLACPSLSTRKSYVKIGVEGHITLRKFLELLYSQHEIPPASQMQVKKLDVHIGDQEIHIDTNDVDAEWNWGLLMGIMLFSSSPDHNIAYVIINGGQTKT